MNTRGNILMWLGVYRDLLPAEAVSDMQSIADGLTRFDPEPVVEECDQGHYFGKLADHPRRNGMARCPHCMAIGLDALRGETAR